MRRLVILSGLLGWGCGDNIKILPDAFVDIDPPTTAASPVPGVYRDGVTVTLTADEDARIFYTLDGTTPSLSSDSGDSPLELGVLEESTEIRFFGVDREQDREVEHAVTYVIDRFGPAPVTGVTTSYAGFGLEVRWTAPTAPGFTDVLVVSTGDVTGTVPEPGMTYAVGDTIGTGTVEYVGTGDRVTFDPPATGAHAFVVWARYDTGEYSEGRTAAALAIPAQEPSQLTIDVVGETGTVTAQPGNATFAITNVNRQGQDISFDVTVTSAHRGVVWNPKLVISAVTNGTFTGDGTLAAGPDMGSIYVDLGPDAWALGESVTRNFFIDTAVDPVTIDLELAFTPGVYAARCNAALGDAGAMLVDRTIGSARDALPRPPTGVDGERYTGAVVSPDGRHVYAGTIAPAIVRIDPDDGTIVDTTSLGTSGDVVDLALDPSGRRLYAAVDDGGALALVELEPGTMTEIGRLPLGTGGAAHALELSRDARWAAIAAEDAIHVVDLSAWVERDADPSDATIQPIAAPEGFAPTAVAFDVPGTTLVCNGDTDRVGAVDLTDAILRFEVDDGDGDATTSSITIAGFVPATTQPGGFWLVGDLQALTRYNPANGMFATTGSTPLVTVAGRVLPDGDIETLAPLELGVFDSGTGAYTVSATLPAATCDRRLTTTPY